MRRIWLGVLVAASLLTPGAGMAQEGGADSTTVQTFLDYCNSPAGSPAEEYCLGYIAGMGTVLDANGVVLETMTSPHDANANALRHFSMCPSGTPPSYGAEEQAFKNWAGAHPEQWTLTAGAGVGLALRETWPCK
jgi:hypothetical protein